MRCRYFALLVVILMFSCLLFACSKALNNTETSLNIEKSHIDNFLKGIYSYEYNTIESKHEELITKWLSAARSNNDQSPISFYSISNETENEGYDYVFAKGYKDFEITFVYSADNPGGKGYVHLAGINGSKDEEVFLKIKYDRRYILGIISSDRTIFTTNH